MGPVLPRSTSPSCPVRTSCRCAGAEPPGVGGLCHKCWHFSVEHPEPETSHPRNHFLPPPYTCSVPQVIPQCSSPLPPRHRPHANLPLRFLHHPSAHWFPARTCLPAAAPQSIQGPVSDPVILCFRNLNTAYCAGSPTPPQVL